MKRLRLIALALVVASSGGPQAAKAQDMPTVLPNNSVMGDILNKQRIEAAIAPRPSGISGATRAPSRGFVQA